jgi:hypothetical protein
MSKKLKKYISERGVNNVLEYIFETLANRWLTHDWFRDNIPKDPQLRLATE